MVPYDLDFESDDFHRAYMDFLNAIGVSRNNTSPNITMEMYRKYCCVFALDLQPDQCNSLHIHSGKTGTVNVEMTFKENLDENLQFQELLYQLFDDLHLNYIGNLKQALKNIGKLYNYIIYI